MKLEVRRITCLRLPGPTERVGQVEAQCARGGTGAYVHWCSPSKVEDTKLGQKASAPDHMCKWAVDESRPQLFRSASILIRLCSTYEDEREHRQYPPALAKAPNSYGGYGCLEHQLELTEEHSRNGADWLCKDTSMQGILEIADHA